MIDCPIEEHVPIPTSTDIPYMEIREKAAAACKAAQLLNAEGYAGADEVPESLRPEMANILGSLAKGKDVQAAAITPHITTPRSAIYVNSILNEYDMEVVQDAKRLRNYVTNKLLLETENMDARVRIKALELLGKITDVGLFTERSEMTINNRSTKELEDSLKSKLRKLMGTEGAEEAVIVAEPKRFDAPIDVSAVLSGKNAA